LRLNVHGSRIQNKEKHPRLATKSSNRCLWHRISIGEKLETCRRLDSEYSSEQGRGHRADTFIHQGRALAIARIFKSPKVLDVGCGEGHFVKHLRKLDVEAYGRDVSRHALKNAPQSVARHLSLIDVETEDLPFRIGYFDVVTAFEVWEHLRNHRKVLAEAHRVLRPGGFLVIATPKPQSNYANFDSTHISVKSMPEWLRLHKKLGFKHSFLRQYVFCVKYYSTLLNVDCDFHKSTPRLLAKIRRFLLTLIIALYGISKPCGFRGSHLLLLSNSRSTVHG